jgi:hypothetical protein
VGGYEHFLSTDGERYANQSRVHRQREGRFRRGRVSRRDDRKLVADEQGQEEENQTAQTSDATGASDSGKSHDRANGKPYKINRDLGNKIKS